MGGAGRKRAERHAADDTGRDRAAVSRVSRRRRDDTEHQSRRKARMNDCFSDHDTSACGRTTRPVVERRMYAVRLSKPLKYRSIRQS